MRTRKVRALLIDALAFGAAASGCARSPEVSPETSDSGAQPTTPAQPASQIDVTPVPVTNPGPAASAQKPAVPRYQVKPDLLKACVDGLQNVLADLKPARPHDYIELRFRNNESQSSPVLAQGTPCASAKAPDDCHAAFTQPVESGFGNGCRPGMCDYHLVATTEDGAAKAFTHEDVVRLLGAIDTPGEALLTAFAKDHAVLACDLPAPTRVGKGWQVTRNLTIEDCPMVTADVTLAISEAGDVTVIATKNKKKSNVCVGRRPPDLVAAERPSVTRASGLGEVGSYLQDSAELEAASVPAFERLERELSALGAPRTLQKKCRRAAADERRHARVMTRLSRARGGGTPDAQVLNSPLRGAFELALDNAGEGCVRETFGALVGLHQAEHAADPEVRTAMRQIAEDEVRHAALAWQIAAFIEKKLPKEQARAVERARRSAIRNLERELAGEYSGELQRDLGLPNRAVALRMARALKQTLWHRGGAPS